MANKSTKSKKPSGLKITRNGNKFVCEWKIPSAKYGDGQKFKATTVDATDISKTATKKTVTIDLSARHPAGKKLTKFSFSVKGNSDPKKDQKKWSDWATEEFNLNAPKKPSITTELTGENKCKFSWSVADSGSDSHYPFTRVQIQTKLVKNCTWDPKDDNWKNADSDTSSSASSYKEITENSGTLAGGNYTRLIRIRAQGCGGNSDWAYAKHVYGAPNKAGQTAGTVKETPGGYDVTVKWDTSRDKSKPIDETVVEWVIATPQSDMSCPSGVTWTTGATVKETAGKEGAHVAVDARLEDDQCLYTRVNTKHDSRITYGTARLQKTGSLAKPTGLSVENVSQESQTAKITATNASAVSGTVLEVIYRKNGSDTIVGLITGSPNYITVKVPAWTDEDSISFGVRAVLPKSTSSDTKEGITIYTIAAHMQSPIVWQSGSIAKAPSNLTLARDGEDVRASWTNNWDDANKLELSWSANMNAWESTDEPETYDIDNPFVTSWRIAGLQAGITWYVRIRALHDNGDSKVYSPYSYIAEINLSSSPNIPALTLSHGVVAIGEGFTASWEYSPTDGTGQSEARIYEYDDVHDTYTELDRVSTQEHMDLPGWDTAGSHLICVEVVSNSGQTSGKSDTTSITVTDPVTCSVSSSLEAVSITDDDGTTRSVISLTELPLTVTATGAGTGGTTALIIKRAEAYHVDRPDESIRDGFKGETIFETSQTGEDQIEITLDDLIGAFDDGAKYELIAMVTDNIGQTAQETVPFEVHWEQQALMPSGKVIIDEEDLIAVLMPEAHEDAEETDRCDIYRLSADKPELIYKGAEFGSKYVDPYPTIGEDGGYRFVCVTANGDYNTAENVLAMYDDEEEKLQLNATVIDFEGDRVILRYNMDVSSDWEKDFTAKKYLGGSVRGYWKEGVTRKGDVGAVAVPSNEEGIIAALRRLCEHVGPCHVRTPEGSSYTADVQCSESWESSNAGKVANFTLKITKVEPEEYDGMTIEEWTGA